MERAWYDTAAFLPNFLAFLAILLIGYFVAKAIASLVDKGLEKVGFENMVERGGIKVALQKSGFHVSDILGKLTFYALFLFVLQMAFSVFGPNPVSDILTRTIAFIPNVIVAILIVVVSAFIANAVKEIAQATLGGLSYGRTLAMVASASILVIGVFAALSQLQIAPAIVNGLFYAMLAIIVGSAVIAIGGGGIKPMQSVWERTLNKVEQETPRLKVEVQNSMEPQMSGAAVVDPATGQPFRRGA
jgi:hypothetical protein